jgi:hypothetical protein
MLSIVGEGTERPVPSNTRFMLSTAYSDSGEQPPLRFFDAFGILSSLILSERLR